jgi:protein involved in polysaccharide export with SLBB domain
MKMMHLALLGLGLAAVMSVGAAVVVECGVPLTPHSENGMMPQRWWNQAWPTASLETAAASGNLEQGPDAETPPQIHDASVSPDSNWPETGTLLFAGELGDASEDPTSSLETSPARPDAIMSMPEPPTLRAGALVLLPAGARFLWVLRKKRSGKNSLTDFAFKNGFDTRLVKTGCLSWLMAMSVCAITGCASEGEQNNQAVQKQLSQSSAAPQSDDIILREGDVVNISFPSSASLNTTQTIRTDGRISLSLIGEVVAAGKTPVELQNDLIKLYEPQVATKEVLVTVQSAGFPIFVTGAVLRPGKIMEDHPLTALEAIMEAGGATENANLAAVVVIRQEKDKSATYKLNLKQVMKGAPGKPFYLKPSDILRVPEKFTWF